MLAGARTIYDQTGEISLKNRLVPATSRAIIKFTCVLQIAEIVWRQFYL